MFFLSRASRPKSRPVVNQGRQSTRRLLLEALEDRVVPALIPSGWLVLSNAGGGSYPGGLYAINPDPKAPNHTPIPISAAGAFDESVGLAEDPSSGVLYSLDYGAGRSDNFSIKVPPSTGTTLARTMRDHALMKVDPTSGITSVVSYDSPGQENLYGSDAVVFLPGSGGSNGNLYVINQGDGGGNLHLLVNVEDNGYPYDPPTHSVVQIDPRCRCTTMVATRLPRPTLTALTRPAVTSSTATPTAPSRWIPETNCTRSKATHQTSRTVTPVLPTTQVH